LPDLGAAKITEYKVEVTDEMINNEITRLQNRYGNMQDVDSVTTEENVLNVIFSEVDDSGHDLENGIKKDNSLLLKYFKESFRSKIKEEIEAYWKSQARNQIHDQAFHQLVDNTEIKFPVEFLKKWLKTQNTSAEKQEEPKSDEQVEQEFPTFLNQLKWTLITDKIVQDNAIHVQPEEI